jgi:hypothetical protein
MVIIELGSLGVAERRGSAPACKGGESLERNPFIPLTFAEPSKDAGRRGSPQ